MAHLATQAPAATGATQQIAAAFNALLARITRYRTYRTTLSELQTLSNRELADLGLSRSMIRRTAYEVAYK